jgi:hypothetical protein
MPDICAVAAEFPELNVVPMSSFPVSKDKDEFMLRSVEGAHSSLILSPDIEIKEGVIGMFAGR